MVELIRDSRLFCRARSSGVVRLDAYAPQVRGRPYIPRRRFHPVRSPSHVGWRTRGQDAGPTARPRGTPALEFALRVLAAPEAWCSRVEDDYLGMMDRSIAVLRADAFGKGVGLVGRRF